MAQGTDPPCSLDNRQEAIRVLNDHARQTLIGCRLCITSGVMALGEDVLHNVVLAVQQFDAFIPGNDPYNEHDFGIITIGETTVFWKFDYYDLDLMMHSPAAHDPNVTARVLTIMLSTEY